MKLSKSVILLTLAFSPWAYSQTAANGWVIENIHGPSQVGIVDTIPVDINKDGLMDVVSASIEDGHLRAYINQGELEFEQQYISTDVLGAFRVAATDFNNDGEVDFLIPSIETQEVIALIYDPSAETYGYRKQIIAENVLLPTDAQAGDFNDDGLMDVVSISFEENVLLLHLQNQQGGFDTTTISEAPQRPRKIVVEDFNNDGVLDILVASEEDNSIRLFSGVDGELFNENLISDQMTGIRFIARCDQANAEYPDFVAGVTGANQVVLFENEQNNLFTSKIIDSDLPGATAMHCADIDSDGFTEVLAISGAEDSIYLYHQEGIMNKEMIANSQDGYVNVNTIDLDNNGLQDVLTQTFFSQRNLIYLSNENQEAIVWEDFPDGLISIQVDENVSNSYFYDAFRTGEIFNSLKGEVKKLIIDYQGVRALSMIDINSDGFMDLFSLNSETNEALSHLNDGSGNYETNFLFNQFNFPTASLKIDILGVKKMLVATTFDEHLWAFDNMVVDSLGTEFSGSFALDVADLNKDQLEDIIIADYIGGKIDLAIQDINGQFNVVQISENKPRVFSVKAIDLDNDGDLDIVSSVNQSNEVWWHENTGTGFTDHLISSDIFNPRDIDVREINGRKYIAVSSFSSNGGGVYLISTTAGDEFTVRQISANKHGSNTLSFIDEPGGIGLLVGGFNNGSLSKLTQIDLIYKNDFE